MKLWLAMRNAVRGWVEIVRNQDGWREQFSLSGAGLGTALAIYFFFAFVAIGYGSLGSGMPSGLGIVVNLLVQGLSISALLIAVYLARIILQLDRPVLEMLVPGIYALVFYLIAGTIVAAIGIQMITLALLGVGYLFYRLGRVAGSWPIGVSVAFAVLTVALLVGLPMTLYMLATPAGSPI